ncbi:uroporphyrinogen-III synthase-like [Coccinella septempunctata]|uniref:uroporphyrinogen-III synthase-like n=1 Tax=Coccinella septempunctata TaxID=41139 RepID=UPI001D081BD7|nr:uroporphyrinogen-III synthase-like [Coccinella septempunctata]
MKIINKSVMLLKTQKGVIETDQYEKLLKSHDFKVKQVNTLIFKYHDLSELNNKLKNCNDYSGILLSSPRCVEAVYLSSGEKQLDSSWRTKLNYTVGEATHLAALERLGIDCRGKESGNAKNLSEIIMKENTGAVKPFLFPHGNLKTDTLKIELGRSNIGVEGVLVYDTLANPNIEEDFRLATCDFTNFPEYVVFFSPSGVRSSIELFRRVPDCLEKIKFIAIGPVTETAMKEENIVPEGVAASPNPTEVLNLLMKKL